MHSEKHEVCGSANRQSILTEYVKRAINGDKWAMEQLVNLFHERVFRMVYFRIRSRMDAEDITQEVFVKMMRKIGGLREPEKFLSWLYRIALNQIRDFSTKKKMLSFFGSSVDTDRVESDESRDIDSQERTVIQKEFMQRFNDMADELPKMEREIFMLRFLDELGIAEISQALKKNENTVKTHLYRAIKKFRDNAEFREMLKGVPS